MSTDLSIMYVKKVYIMSRKAEAIPPLGTILGNIGVNTIKFCEEFNNFTKDLPFYFTLKVIIKIYENRSFKFGIETPSTSSLLNILKFEKTIKIRVHDRINKKIITCIYLNDLIQIALFKFPNLKLEKSILIIWGSIKAMDLIVI